MHAEPNVGVGDSSEILDSDLGNAHIGLKRTGAPRKQSTNLREAYIIVRVPHGLFMQRQMRRWARAEEFKVGMNSGK